ncbi:MAG: hypothetical protein D3904_13105 [Candidatus Electrothrix sp. EH2]|nr:hypothetical protein [Candidatus Electrothrix sp. EH2]
MNNNSAHNFLDLFRRDYCLQFLAAYEHDGIEDALDFAEWIGEIRMLNRLHEKFLYSQSA